MCLFTYVVTCTCQKCRDCSFFQGFSLPEKAVKISLSAVFKYFILTSWLFWISRRGIVEYLTIILEVCLNIDNCYILSCSKKFYFIKMLRNICNFIEMGMNIVCIRQTFHSLSNPLLLITVFLSTIRRNRRRCSIKKVSLKIWQYSQENNCVGVSFEKSCRPSGTYFEKHLLSPILLKSLNTSLPQKHDISLNSRFIYYPWITY